MWHVAWLPPCAPLPVAAAVLPTGARRVVFSMVDESLIWSLGDQFIILDFDLFKEMVVCATRMAADGFEIRRKGFLLFFDTTSVYFACAITYSKLDVGDI